MVIYGYLRVSSDEQDVNNQKSGVVEFAKQKGWEIKEWIIDDGVSGTKTPEKRQLGTLMKMCAKGDIIICSELSRLGRKMLMVMAILEYCMRNEIMIYTVKDNYVLGDNVQSQVLAFAFSLAAQIERDMIAMRTREALIVRKKAGVLLGSPRMANKVARVPEEVVRKMEYMAESGVSLSAIARKLDLHRITVGYYLTKSETFKGVLDGYNIEYFNGNKIKLTKRNATEYGLYYKHIKDAYLSGKDMSTIGIKSIEPSHTMPSKDYHSKVRDYLNRSDHPNINRDEITRFVLAEMTIPEIHSRLGNEVTYEEVYDFISDDTYLSNEYRTRGHVRCKSQRK